MNEVPDGGILPSSQVEGFAQLDRGGNTRPGSFSYEDEVLVELWNKRISAKRIALKMGKWPKWVYRRSRELGLTRRWLLSDCKMSSRNLARASEIVSMKAWGMSLAQIGAVKGISKQRVWEIIDFVCKRERGRV